ncbi:hypothetical protein PVIIG_06199 [Plasmodium vivax India VII]|uniref:VIR protein n=1 Tax=Plasmodium vivax India VII TaxID=1077284 RepID=A0A0J9V8R7_PLAVI|nr:hypothetical protein PVIIG_06199 [Plasmodium vivax India VII]
MSEIETDKVLLTYEKYFDLQKRFNSPYSKDQDGLNEKEFLDETEFKINNRYVIRPILEKLLNHIRNRGIFIYNEDKACSYISYIFSKELQNEVDKYEQETFEMFKKFVNKYNTRPNHTSSICPNDLIYVHSKMYAKMHKLYVLYEDYKNLLDKHKFGDTKSCSAVYLFLKGYNEFIRENQPTNEHFNSILKHFEKEIERNVKIYDKHTCPNDSFHIQEIKLHSVSKNEKAKASDELEQQKKNAEHEVSQSKRLPSVVEPHVSRTESHAKSQTYRVESERAHEQSQPPREKAQPFHETLVHNAQDAEQEQEQGLQYVPIPNREFPIDSSPGHIPRYEPLESSGTTLYADRNPYSYVQSSSNEVGDTSSSVMNTITSALKDVEPGPVLVVSGGMGVLFLLFKEEDEFIKFLVVLEDFHQEISQIFRNMMVGLLDIVQ